jgi:hypothetical protein
MEPPLPAQNTGNLICVGPALYSKNTNTAPPSLVGIAPARNAVVPFFARRCVVFLSITLVPLILICICIGWIVLGPLWRREGSPLEDTYLKRGHTSPQDPDDAKPGHV